jgi:hypothetical protein
MKAYGGGPWRAFDAQLVESARSFLFFRNRSDNPFAAPILFNGPGRSDERRWRQ